LADDIFDVPDVPLPDPRNGTFKCPADGAKFMASLGIPQIVLRGKRPFMPAWPEKATLDFDQIDAWAKEYPGCNFGSVAKQNIEGFFALEVDSVDVRATFKKENPGQDFTAALIIQSGEGRGHRWYKYSQESLYLPNIGQEDAAGFSLRVNNEQCVSPGSIHPERHTQYTVYKYGTPTPPSIHEIAWFHSKKSQIKEIKKAKIVGEKRVLIRHGAMYDALISQAGRLWNQGFPPADIPDMLVSWAHENCEAPIDEKKVRSYAAGANWKQGEPGAEWVYSGAYEETAVEIVEEELPAFPRFPGLLTELCDAVCPDIPYEFKFMSAATHWGLIRSGKDYLDGEMHVQPRFYTCLVAEPGYGKTAAMNEIRNFAKMWGVPCSMMSSVDSGPALVDEFTDVRSQMVLKGVGSAEAATSFPARVILDTDEMSDLFEKSKVTIQGRNSLFTEFLKLYEGNRTGNRSRKSGKAQLDDAHLAILAGATPVGYERMWTGTGGGSSGLQSRFVPISTVNGKMPVNKVPSNAEALATIIPRLYDLANKPGFKIEMSEEAKTRFAAWWGNDRAKPSESRVEDMVKRMLIILAVTTGTTIVTRDMIELGILFGEYVIAAREKFNPNDSYSFTQAFEEDIRKVAERHPQSMTQRDFVKLINPGRKPGGLGPFIQAFRNAIAVGELVPDGTTHKGTVKYRLSIKKGE